MRDHLRRGRGLRRGAPDAPAPGHGPKPASVPGRRYAPCGRGPAPHTSARAGTPRPSIRESRDGREYWAARCHRLRRRRGPYRMQPEPRIREPVHDLQAHAKSHACPVTDWWRRSLRLQGDCLLQGRHGETAAEPEPVQRQVGKSVRQEVSRRRFDALEQVYRALRVREIRLRAGRTGLGEGGMTASPQQRVIASFSQGLFAPPGNRRIPVLQGRDRSLAATVLGPGPDRGQLPAGRQSRPCALAPGLQARTGTPPP